MTSANDFDRDPLQHILFAARLTPHRSLNRTGFIALMIFLSAVSFAAGTAFMLMGAWPVFGFFGLDVLVIYWAFKVNFRHAYAYEEVSVSYAELRVRRVNHRGHSIEWFFNPVWVRIDRESHSALETGLDRIYLVARGRRISLGHHLGADEKESFCNALAASLAEARRGPTHNPLNNSTVIGNRVV